MKKIIRNILRAWYSELYHVLHNQGLAIFLILVPLGYPLLYSFIYNNETVREVPVAVVDESHSALSREFVRKVDAMAECAVAYHTDLAEAQELMRQEKVYGVLRIPSTFAQDIHAGRQTYIGAYSDMRCMLYYKSILVAASYVSLDMNADIKVKNYLRGSTDRQEAVIRMPVENDHVALFNPQSGFATFLIPAVLMLMIQQLICLSLGMSNADYRERNRGIALPQWVRRDDCVPSALVFGSALFYVLWFVLVAMYMYACVTHWFGLLQLADFPTLLLFLLPYLLASAFLGITLSAFIHRREDTMLVFVFLSPILLFLSGMSWPVAAEPQFWRYLSWLFPSTFGMHGYVRIASMGATLQDVLFEWRGLWLQCIGYFLTACMVVGWQKRKLPPPQPSPAMRERELES